MSVDEERPYTVAQAGLELALYSLSFFSTGISGVSLRLPPFVLSEESWSLYGAESSLGFTAGWGWW